MDRGPNRSAGGTLPKVRSNASNVRSKSKGDSDVSRTAAVFR